jgi:glycine betaine transporter
MLILAAFPFSIIMILMTASLIKALGKDYKQVKRGNKTKKVS